MAKKWNLIIVLIIFVFVTFSFSMATSKESAENGVGVKVALFCNYATDLDNVENVPLEWSPRWHFDTSNKGNDTHEPVINPRITVKSSLSFIRFSPDNPKVFISQPEIGLYEWNFTGYEIPVLTQEMSTAVSCLACLKSESLRIISIIRSRTGVKRG